MTVTFRPATKEDVKSFIGPEMVWSCHAIVAENDGEVVGCGGVYYCGGLPVAFSSFDESMREFPLALARGAVKVMEIVREHDCIAIADDRYGTAPDLLKRLGFEHIEGGYFQWRRR